MNIPGVFDVEAASAIHIRPKGHCLSEPLDLKDVVDAKDATIEGKAPEKCGISVEIWNYDGTGIVSKLHQLILFVWEDTLSCPARQDTYVYCPSCYTVISVRFQKWSRHYEHDLLLEADTREMHRAEHNTACGVPQLN